MAALFVSKTINVPIIKFAQISTKVKSLVQLFKGGRFPKGGAIWSPSAEGEILSLAVIIKLLADKLKIAKPPAVKIRKQVE